jgi:hypothetical protein
VSEDLEMPPDPFLEPEPGEEGKTRFIAAMDDPVAAAAELETLAVWVEDVLLPVYGREVSTTALWCPCWWDHKEAVARLHAAYLAWLDLTGPEAELYGPALWHRDYLDPMWAALRGHDGPFAACGETAERSAHVVLKSPASQPVGEYGPFARPRRRPA